MGEVIEGLKWKSTSDEMLAFMEENDLHPMNYAEAYSRFGRSVEAFIDHQEMFEKGSQMYDKLYEELMERNSLEFEAGFIQRTRLHGKPVYPGQEVEAEGVGVGTVLGYFDDGIILAVGEQVCCFEVPDEQ